MAEAKSSQRKRRFRLDMVVGNREYFLRQASSGFVGGPKTRDGLDRHITVAVDPQTELIRHVHMKSGPPGSVREDWRVHPERIMTDVNEWIRSNSVPLATEDVARIYRSSYVVSARRMMITYKLLQGFGSKVLWIFVRGFRFIPFDIIKHDEETRVGFVVDPDRLQGSIRRLTPLLVPFKFALPMILPRLLKRLAKMQLIRIRDMADGDVSVVFSREGAEPTVVVKQGQFRNIKLERVINAATDLYSRFKIAEIQPNFEPDPRQIRMQLTVRDSEA